jgi:hypothetical protein
LCWIHEYTWAKWGVARRRIVQTERG